MVFVVNNTQETSFLVMRVLLLPLVSATKINHLNLKKITFVDFLRLVVQLIFSLLVLYQTIIIK